MNSLLRHFSGVCFRGYEKKKEVAEPGYGLYPMDMTTLAQCYHLKEQGMNQIEHEMIRWIAL